MLNVRISVNLISFIKPVKLQLLLLILLYNIHESVKICSCFFSSFYSRHRIMTSRYSQSISRQYCSPYTCYPSCSGVPGNACAAMHRVVKDKK